MKGQTSMEGLIILGFFLVMFLMISGVILERDVRTTELGSDLSDRDVCLNFANEIYSVYILGEGAVSQLNLQTDIKVYNYSVGINNSLCDVCCNITAKNSSSNEFTLKNFTLPKGRINITNFGGFDIRIESLDREITGGDGGYGGACVNENPPVVTLESPLNQHIESTTNTIDFLYHVEDYDSLVDSCTLFIDDVSIFTDTTITEVITQTFTYTLENGNYLWDVKCTDTGCPFDGDPPLEGESSTWELIVDVLPNTSIFFDTFEDWEYGNCGEGVPPVENPVPPWTYCDAGDGELKRDENGYNESSGGIKFSDHDADVDYLIKCLDLSGYSSLYVDFWRQKLGLDSGEYGKLDVSTTGVDGDYTNIFDSGSGISSYLWKSIDVSGYIGTDTCFKWHVLADTPADKFFIDEFEIKGQITPN